MINLSILRKLKKVLMATTISHLKDEERKVVTAKQTNIDKSIYVKSQAEKDIIKSHSGKFKPSVNNSSKKREKQGDLLIHVLNKGLRENNTRKHYKTTYRYNCFESEINYYKERLKRQGESILIVRFNNVVLENNKIK